ncbi:hypothetical protein D3C78_1526760 [compost metagenome]
MAALEQHVAHRPALRLLAGESGALAFHLRLVELEEVDAYFAVHDDGELIVGAGEPGGLAFGAQHLDHVAEVQADHRLLVGRRLLGDFEDVGEGVVTGLALHQLDGTLAVVIE